MFSGPEFARGRFVLTGAAIAGTGGGRTVSVA